MQSSEQKFCGCSLKLQDGDFVWIVDPNNKTPMRILNVKCEKSFNTKETPY